jgi:hypothetical protein
LKSPAFLVSTLLLLVALTVSNPARATSSLSFEGDGYWIDMEIGDSATPALARVRFHSPGDDQGIVLSRKLVTVTAFDPTHRTLTLGYVGGSGVAPFLLSVHGSAATLDIGGKQVQAGFDWDM